MPHYVSLGEIPAKRHTQLRDPSGQLRYEELAGAAGFAGPSSLLYHLGAPTRILSIEPAGTLPGMARAPWDGQAVRPHLLRTDRLPVEGDPVDARRMMSFNDDLSVSVARPTRRMDYFYRNGRADELIFVHEGTGRLRTAQGSIDYRALDHLVIPRGTTYQIDVDEGVEQRWVVIEGNGAVAPPSRYRNDVGQYLVTSPFSERDFTLPSQLETFDEAGEFRVLVKAGEEFLWHRYDRHPFDVVGWDGYLYPYALNLMAVETVAKAVHPAPPYFQTFEGQNFVTFAMSPRPAEYYPGAIPIQPYHSSFDCDEISYAVVSPRGAGTMAFHPGYIPHGVLPGIYEASVDWTEFNVCVLLIDTFRPLHLAAAAAGYDDDTYMAQARA